MIVPQTELGLILLQVHVNFNAFQFISIIILMISLLLHAAIISNRTENSSQIVQLLRNEVLVLPYDTSV